MLVWTTFFLPDEVSTSSKADANAAAAGKLLVKGTSAPGGGHSLAGAAVVETGGASREVAIGAAESGVIRWGVSTSWFSDEILNLLPSNGLCCLIEKSANYIIVIIQIVTFFILFLGSLAIDCSAAGLSKSASMLTGSSASYLIATPMVRIPWRIMCSCQVVCFPVILTKGKLGKLNMHFTMKMTQNIHVSFTPCCRSMVKW